MQEEFTLKETFMIGVDIGTTSTKAVLFNEKGHPVTKHSVEYPLLTPTPGTAEQNPEEILLAVVKSIREVLTEQHLSSENISFVSFSSAMHSLIAVDSDGKPITNCITWADNRSAKWAEKIKSEMNGHEIYMRTGTPIHPMSPLSKLLWMKNEKEDVFSKASKFISIKEYVFYRFFHKYVIDYSIASATGLFNLEKLDWDEEALEIAGVTKDELSTPVSTTTIVDGLKEPYIEEIGLSESTKFVVGASDGVLSNLGVNAIDPGVVAVTIGTSGAIRAVTDRPVTDPHGRIFCYALTENKWVIGGPVNNGGITFRWVRDQFAASEMETAKRLGIDTYEILTRIAEQVRPGSDGLIFHPYLAGERAPLWNSDARGSFFGLAMHHKKEHMIRAVLEGVIFNLYSVLEALKELIGEPKQIKATGGFSRSALWRQMMADIFNEEVIVPESYESSCLGAIVLGMEALGDIDSYSIVSDLVGSTFAHQPEEESVKLYSELLPIYTSISQKLTDEYKAISAFQTNVLGK
ncbi:gluconokinase [Alkalihalobacillus sp. R86527]|uniref:gluconokinase n=1 Tax=Alkalihalobacillus sp. R86527 TaxID=3093863 RepID=UPI0036726672